MLCELHAWRTTLKLSTNIFLVNIWYVCVKWLTAVNLIYWQMEVEQKWISCFCMRNYWFEISRLWYDRSVCLDFYYSLPFGRIMRTASKSHSYTTRHLSTFFPKANKLKLFSFSTFSVWAPYVPTLQLIIASAITLRYEMQMTSQSHSSTWHWPDARQTYSRIHLKLCSSSLKRILLLVRAIFICNVLPHRKVHEWEIDSK